MGKVLLFAKPLNFFSGKVNAIISINSIPEIKTDTMMIFSNMDAKNIMGSIKVGPYIA